MLAKYQYLTTATAAQVQADILLLLTGTTSTASLSASCDKPNSSILTTYDSAGWTSYDSAAYTNGFCVRALQQDGVTYKYLTFEASSTTNFAVRIAEAWNSGTHAGTNVTGAATNTWSASSGGVFWIYATQQLVVIRHSNTAANSFTNTIACIEMDNTDGMIIAGYPTQGLVSYPVNTATAATAGTFCRIKHPNGAGDLTTTSAILAHILTIASDKTALQCAMGCTFRDASETVQVCFMEPGYSQQYATTSPGNTYGIPGKQLGKMKFGPQAYTTPAFADTIVIGSTTYFCFARNSATFETIWVANG